MERALASKLPHARDFLTEITNYIGLDPDDSARLRAFLPAAAPHFERISEHVDERISAHPQPQQVIAGHEAQLPRLARSLVEWMQIGLEGPHDEEFCLRLARIGYAHVRSGLPQRYIIVAMHVMRLDLREVAHEAFTDGDPIELEKLYTSLERLFDLELAIMLETYELEATERLRRHQRLAMIGQVAASIGHDLRNPLSVMESSLYILRRRVVEDPRASKHVDKIGNQIHECDRIISNLLNMARDQAPRRQTVRAADLLASALTAARVPPDFNVVLEGLSDLELWVDASLLEQAFINLLINSVQAQCGHDGQICVRAHVDGPDVTISVVDAGPGFDLETLPIIFEPLVTTKATGTGLGLALVKSVTERHGGRVSADNRSEGGAEVKMYLPDAIPSSN
jgi:two-component system sensor histidine kinase HydH